MSDDFDFPLNTLATMAIPAAAEATSVAKPTEPAVSAPASPAPPTLLIALYKSGADVQYQGESHTVSHVHISKHGLFVRLNAIQGVVPAEKVNVPLTRMALPLGSYQPAPVPLGPADTQ